MIILHGFKIFVLAMFQTFGELALVGLQVTIKTFKKYPRSYAAISYLFIAMAFCYYPICILHEANSFGLAERDIAH